ncbi:hypothetical protein ACT3SP_02765 [Brachybacterium sp. AOP43-C2-M15]|uniref:hypothetical protein n=1 Tax=Brachybacterium sp. AOP43-C2-M15 TaxID=3457661 RepID=UPI0040348488
MDEVDDERFSRGAHWPPPGPPPAGGAEVPGEREEVPGGAPQHPDAVQVRGHGSQGESRVRAELQLLAALEVAGITAAPAVLEIEDDGYVREAAPVLVHRSGRRSAGVSTPPTAERLALARARTELDALIESLHERGWVLGAPSGSGLGVREDGGVVVLDLSGLRRGRGLAERRADRRWVDSVLGDQERTLRRRVDHPGRPWDGARIDPGAVGEGSGRQDRARSPAGSSPPAVPVPDPAPGPGHVPTRPPTSRALPPRSRRGHRAAARHLSAVREVLAQPRQRRIASASALAVLLLGAVIGGGLWWGQEQAPAEVPTSAGAAPSADGPERTQPPRIEDPWSLAADVAGARHAFVTGVSDRPAAVADSAALAADEDLRVAYRGLEVHGGGPVVHAAQLVEGPGPDGVAVLRAETSMAAHRIEDADGAITDVAATGRVTVLLTLRWEREGWLIESVEEI